MHSDSIHCPNKFRPLASLSFDWIRRFAGWLLFEPHIVFLLLPVALAAVFVLSGPAELRVRIFGITLQLSGIGTTVYAIHKKGVLFKFPKPFAWVAARIAQFPPWRKNVSVIPGPALLRLASFAPTVQVTPVSLPSLEERVAALEKTFIETDVLLQEMRRYLDKEVGRLQGAIESEGQERRSDSEEIREHIRAAVAGDLYWDLVGIGWLFLGTVCSTFSPEISRIFL